MDSQHFIKHIVRRPLEDMEPTRVFARATSPSATDDMLYTVTVSGTPIVQTEKSSLSPKAVVIVTGGLAVLWLVFLTMGILCKFFNKPRSANHAGDYMASKGLYQPSAAAYADRSSQATTPQVQHQDPRKMYGSKTNLLASAGPMGKGSFDSPSDPATPDLSLSMSRTGGDYFDTPDKTYATRQPGQHHRTTSSSVGMPGPAASRRGPGAGAQQQHPPMGGGSAAVTMSIDPFTDGSGSPAGPDGSGFRPGQVFNHSAFGTAGPSAAGPSHLRNPPAAPAGPRSSRVFKDGPPPARSNSNRRSRYSRAPRIESLGPGQIRASRYFDEAAGWEQGAGMGAVGTAGSPPRAANNRKSRYGENRMSTRRSQYGFGPGSGLDATRSPSIYGLQAAEEDAIRRAQAEGFGAGDSTPDFRDVRSKAPMANGYSAAAAAAPGRSGGHPLGLAKSISPPEASGMPARRPSPLGAMNGGPRYPAHAPGPHSGAGMSSRLPTGGGSSAHNHFAMRAPPPPQPQFAGGPGGPAGGSRQLV